MNVPVTESKIDGLERIYIEIFDDYEASRTANDKKHIDAELIEVLDGTQICVQPGDVDVGGTCIILPLSEITYGSETRYTIELFNSPTGGALALPLAKVNTNWVL